MVWASVELGDVCEFIDRRGVTPKKLGSDFLSSGFRVISAKNIKGRDVVTDVGDQRYVDEVTYQKWMKSPLMPDDVLLTSEAPLGEPAYISEKLEWCLGQRLFGLRTDKSKLYGRFLFHGLQSNTIRQDLFSRATGATAQGIRQSELQKVKIPLPSIPEQKRIVSILDQVFVDIDKARALTEQNLKNARELFENYLQQVFSQRGEGWTQTTLGCLCEKMEYGTSEKSSPQGKVPVLRMGNIQNGELDWKSLVYTDNQDDIDKLSLKDGDVLFNRTNSPELVGKTAIFRGNRPAVFAGYLIRVHTIKRLLDSDYLNFYLNSAEAREYGFKVMSHSTNQANISGSKLKGYPINLPCIEEQQKISSSLRTLELEVKKVEKIYGQKLLKLELLRKSILKKAFSGELTKDKQEAA